MTIISQVERSAMHRVAGWMKDIIKEEKLPFQVEAEIEMTSFGNKRKFPDILIFRKYPNEVACLIEFKSPYPYDPYDPELVDSTYEEANRAPGNLNGTCRYFGTWNLNKFVLWDKKEYSAESFLDMIYKPYDVAQARDINDVTRSQIEESVKKFLRKFLKEFYEIYFEIKPAPALHIDELFIYRLRTAMDTFSIPISENLFEEAKRNIRFKSNLRRWFSEQGWLFQDKLDDYDRTARQYTYLIVDKVLFYNALRIHKKELDEIKIEKKISAEEFKKQLQNYFDKALKIDYEPIFAENFLETLPLPDLIIPQIVSFVDSLNHRYNFSSIGYEIIGRVFERLIPENERHKLGQYFTKSDVVDLINSFCIKSRDDIVLDPGCGAATFLIRAYSNIRQKNKSKSHREILDQLFGIDISKFAAHLSMINLSIKDLSEKENYPYIINKDFFDIFPKQIIERKYKIKTLSGEHTEIKIPYVDAVIGNPPYTRQEEMESAFEEKYKDKLNSIIRKDFNISIGKRSGIYAYFFIHGSKFLKDGGRFGFITSNSWLDVDFGKYLQEFFLNNFKITAIIQSKVERWFEDADVNTCITILQRCKNDEERDANLVKFVQLKKPINELISYREEDEKRLESFEKLTSLIDSKNRFFENDEIKIFPKKQNDLYFEGYDKENNRYVGTRWSKYIRAPRIFFKILEEKGDLFTTLKELSQKIEWGSIKTGADKFFYLTESDIKRYGIEKEFWMNKEKDKWLPNYVIKSPKESKSIRINTKDLKYKVLIIEKEKKDLRKTNILRYLQKGEEEEIDKRPTCASRGKERWFNLSDCKEKRAPLLWPGGFWNRYIIFYNKNRILADRRLFNIYPKEQNEKKLKIILAILNSTLSYLFSELYEKTVFGQGLLLADVYAIEKIPVIKIENIKSRDLDKINDVFSELEEREIGSVFQEIGARDVHKVSFKNIKRDRKELDKIIFDILGLSQEDRLDIYKAVIDLAKSRIERARSVKKKVKKSGIDLGLFADNILEETRLKELKKFPEEYLGDIETNEKELPEGNSVEIGNDLFNGLHVRVDGEIVKCTSMEEAKFIKYAVLNGQRVVQLPEKKEDLARIAKEYDALVTEIKTKAEKLLKEEVKDKKLKEKILREIDRKIFRK